jgi:hypothetical protein
VKHIVMEAQWDACISQCILNLDELCLDNCLLLVVVGQLSLDSCVLRAGVDEFAAQGFRSEQQEECGSKGYPGDQIG